MLKMKNEATDLVENKRDSKKRSKNELKNSARQALSLSPSGRRAAGQDAVLDGTSLRWWKHLRMLVCRGQRKNKLDRPFGAR